MNAGNLADFPLKTKYLVDILLFLHELVMPYIMSYKLVSLSSL